MKRTFPSRKDDLEKGCQTCNELGTGTEQPCRETQTDDGKGEIAEKTDAGVQVRATPMSDKEVRFSVFYGFKTLFQVVLLNSASELINEVAFEANDKEIEV